MNKSDFPDKSIRLITEIGNDDGEFIPLISMDDEERINNEIIPETIPLLPLKNTVLFPGAIIPITVGRDKSIKLIKEAYAEKKSIGVVSQKDTTTEEPKLEDLNKIGTIATIIKLLQMPDNSTTVIIQGKRRFELLEITETDPYFIARIKPFGSNEIINKDKKFDALIESIKDLAIHIVKNSPHLPQEAAFAIKNIDSHSFLISFISSNLNITVEEKQTLLELSDLRERAQLVLTHLKKELQMLDLKNQIQSKVKVDMDKQQRDYYLNQQLKTIQEELGGQPHEQELKELKEKAAGKLWNDATKSYFEKELSKLQRMNPAAAEFSVLMNYLELMVELPWNEYTKDNFDLKRAQKILDRDHFGLEKIKERILEYLAVLKLRNDMKAPILCLVGPPGVGKTSLGKSIAESIKRKYIRISLGGLRDEAEIRGHRKTYIGAMPGRIIQSLKKAQSSNPVFILDEIDKIAGNTFNGDPASAMLEVLDPEQNSTFYDNYLEVDYDLSKIMFIATANSLSSIHPALIDRMEVIDISGYLLEEKQEIAIRHLIPKQLEEHGVKKQQIEFPKDIITKLIEQYTRESGVRQIEKTIARVIRYRAKNIVAKEDYSPKLKTEDIHTILGAPIFKKEDHIIHHVPGVVTGLAWTAAGGEILFIEVSLSRGKGNLTLTGNLGDVMKESATIALEYLKSHADDFGLAVESFDKYNVHIHVPEGATPKDGPSAGVTMFTALLSAFTGRPAKSNIAMTGEITLRGKVLPVGGIKEKILAAKRAHVTDVILCADNKKDVEDINAQYLAGLNFTYISEMHELKSIALTPA